jgi:hypothetical protein
MHNERSSACVIIHAEYDMCLHNTYYIHTLFCTYKCTNYTHTYIHKYTHTLIHTYIYTHTHTLRLVKGALPVDAVTYEEAAELAFFGAEVLHPISMQPAIASKIPVRVKVRMCVYVCVGVGLCLLRLCLCLYEHIFTLYSS